MKTVRKIGEIFTACVAALGILTAECFTVGADAPNIFAIDTVNVYSGMPASYSQGYTPWYSNGVVGIIMPVTASEPLAGNKINASLNLGSTTNTPFVFKSYEKEFRLGTHNVNGGENIADAFLINFSIELISGYKSGVYPVVVNITGETVSGDDATASFTVYVNLTAEDDSAASKGAVTIDIENEYLYSDMNASYSNGYQPKVNNGKVKIVLPLAVSGEIDGKLSVVADTGNSSAIEASNQRKAVELLYYNSTIEKYIYLAEFTFNLKDNYSGGTSSVSFSVSGYGMDGTKYSATFPVYVSLESADEASGFYIANDKVFSGMNSSYQDGYIPEISDDTATVMLPLAAKGGYSGEISATARTSDSSVFRGINYNKTFGRRSDGYYLLKFELPLNPERKNGTYPVEISVTADGVASSFTVYVIISDEITSWFDIDSENVYGDMGVSYSDGYKPVSENGTASVILPVIPRGTIIGDLTVKAEITDNTNETFEVRSYDETVSETEGVYIINYDFKLLDTRKNGVYPIKITVSGKTSSGKTAEQVFTVYVTVNDEKSSGFYIDNQNVYSGMDLSYSDGYKPSVRSGIATVVLPVKAESEMKGELKVKAEISDNTNETFEIRNYEKNVSQNGGVYVVRFDFNLLSTRKNGVYAVKFTVSGTTVGGKTVEQVFTVYVTVSDSGSGSSSPGVIVTGFETDEYYAAGVNFTGKAVLENINKSAKAYNLQIRISTQSQGIESLNNTNVIYRPEMTDGKLELDLDFRVLNSASEGKHSINLDISYEDENGSSRSTSAVLYVNVRHAPDVELETNGLDSRITAGDTVTLTADIYNMGQSSIHNVMVKVEGHGLLPNKTYYIGTMNAESGQSASVDVFVGSKTMSDDYEGSEKYGFTEGKIILTYEDASGNEYTDEYKISTQINAPTSTEASGSSVETDGSWWVSLLSGACILAFTGVFLFYTKRRGKWGSA